MPKITTTIRPDVELDVDDEEYAELKAQGLIATEADAPRDEKEPAADAGSRSRKNQSGHAATEKKEQ